MLRFSEETMQIFCDSFNFNNLVKFPTCYKNPNYPSCIDLILTNKANSFCNTLAVETGLSYNDGNSYQSIST